MYKCALANPSLTEDNINGTGENVFKVNFVSYSYFVQGFRDPPECTRTHLRTPIISKISKGACLLFGASLSNPQIHEKLEVRDLA